MNTQRQLQQHSKWMRLQVMQRYLVEFDELYAK